MKQSYSYFKCALFQTLRRLKTWGASNEFFLNATFVEQKLKNFADVQGQTKYSILREDFDECLELYKVDLSKKLPPDTVSRLITLHRVMYGNRTEIDNALVRI